MKEGGIGKGERVISSLRLVVQLIEIAVIDVIDRD